MAVLSQAASTLPSPYCLANLAGLALGHRIVPAWSLLENLREQAPAKLPPPNQTTPLPACLTGTTHTPPGIYNVQQLIVKLSPLLDSVLSRLGDDTPGTPPAQSVLVDGLAALLATSGRESTLPLTTEDSARGELSHQAARVSKTIIHEVKQSIGTSPGADLRIRSPCEGHLWTPAVVSLLFGPRSNSDLMQLYNEWLHNLILLRDALLPFENYEELPLMLSETGLRAAEEPRKLFLVRCLTGSIQNSSIVDLAKVFTAPGLGHGGYGFQYAQGVVLPAFLSGSRSRTLLRYHPSCIYQPESDIIFDYEHKDYFSAPRTDLSSAQAVAAPDAKDLDFLPTLVTGSSLDVEETHDSLTRIVKLRLTFGCGSSVSVDLGQIARGRRYAYETHAEGAIDVDGVIPRTLVYNAGEVLSKSGLVISPRVQEGSHHTVHVIPAQSPLLKLALLGKLYPENVILVKDESELFGAHSAGKSFAERVVILEEHQSK